MRLALPLLLFFAALTARAADSITVSDAYVRASIPGQPNTAAFATLHNKSGQAVTLASLQSPAAKTVELHRHENHNGTMRMRKVESFSLAAGNTTNLQDAGMHIMLMALEKPLEEGRSIHITFCFDNNDCVTGEFPVTGIKRMQHKHH